MSYDNWEYISKSDYENPKIELSDKIKLQENFMIHKQIIPDKKQIIPDKKQIILDKKQIIPDKKQIIPDKKQIIPDKKPNRKKGIYLDNSFRNETVTISPSKSESIIHFILNNQVPYDICDILYDY